MRLWTVANQKYGWQDRQTPFASLASSKQDHLDSGGLDGSMEESSNGADPERVGRG
jgi:hypothetical protein